jgi:hypothetical protein
VRRPCSVATEVPRCTVTRLADPTPGVALTGKAAVGKPVIVGELHRMRGAARCEDVLSNEEQVSAPVRFMADGAFALPPGRRVMMGLLLTVARHASRYEPVHRTVLARPQQIVAGRALEAERFVSARRREPHR